MQFLHFIVGFTLFISAFISFVSADDRVMGWNKAHGLWGKRSVASDASQNKRTPQNWNKLNSLWGKRSVGGSANSQFDDDVVIIDNDQLVNDDDVAFLMKRSQAAQWQRANGLWGK